MDVLSSIGNLKSKILNRQGMKHIIGPLAIFVTLAPCGAALAQQPTKHPTIGYLSAPPLSVSAARIEAFRQGLRELGYVDEKNIVIEWRSAEGKSDRLPALATELVRFKLDVIVTGVNLKAAKQIGLTIPPNVLARADKVIR